MKRVLIAIAVPLMLTGCLDTYDSDLRNANALKKWQDEHKAEWEARDRAEAEYNARQKAEAEAAAKRETTKVSGGTSAADAPGTINLGSGNQPTTTTEPAAPASGSDQSQPSGGGCH